MKKKVALFLATLMLVLSPAEFLADAANVQATEDEAPGEVQQNTGLLAPEVIEIQPELIESEVYDYKDLAAISLYSYEYNSEWDTYSSNYFYNQLDDEMREIWDAWDMACLSYMLEESDGESAGDGVYCTDYIDIGVWDRGEQELYNYMQMFRLDNPQYYFINHQMIVGSYPSTGEWVVAFGMYDSFVDGADRMEATSDFQNQIEALADACEDIASEDDRLMKIQEVVAEKVTYNDGVLSAGSPGGGEVTLDEENQYFTQSAYSVFCTDMSVCAGYSKATQILCNKFSIQCASVVSADHQWNKVFIFDDWYNVDVTWADQDENGIRYTYFGRSDEFYRSDNTSHIEEAWQESYLIPCYKDTEPVDTWTPGSFDIKFQAPTVATPYILATPINSGYNINITCATPGVDIYYIVNEYANPSYSETRAYRYTGTFFVQQLDSIRAIAYKSGYWSSEYSTDYEIGEATNYTISYTLNGGKNHADNPILYRKGEEVVLKNASRTGYTFAGWYTESTFQNKITKISTTTSGNIALYAKWTVNKYSVKFDKNSGASGTMANKTGMKYGTTYTLTANAYKRKGYTFAGWNTKADGTGTAYADNAKVKNLTATNGKTITLYAQWRKIKYTITYKLNNGKNSTSNPASYYVTTATITLKNPTRKGYTFKGWYSDSKLTKPVTQIATGSTGNKIFYAKWGATKYTVTYKLNGGKNNTKNPAAYWITSSTKYLKNPTRKGYTFKGWYSDSKLTKKVTQITAGSTGNKTFYAKWGATKYTVTYKLNGGKNNTKNPTAYWITSSTKYLKNPTRKGYTFKGWYSDSKLTKKVTQITAGSTGNKTFYAKWSATKYTITYKLNGGKNSSKNPSSYKITTSTITLKNPTKKGYTFKGWYSDSKFKTKVSTIKSGSTGNKTLYAKWKKK